MINDQTTEDKTKAQAANASQDRDQLVHGAPHLKFLAASSAASMAFSSSAVLGADPGVAPERGVAFATCSCRSASVNHSNIM